MKNLFFGSLIPLLLLTIHSVKHINIFLVVYFAFYCLHLSGRPFYNISVIQIYHIHRVLECMVLLNFNIFIKCTICILFLICFKAKVCLPPVYAFFTFLALPVCNGYSMYIFNILSTIVLNVCIILFDLPPHRNHIEMYFYIRMTKNYILAFLIWLNSPLSILSLPIIVIVNIIYYYMVEEDEPIDKEYFINEIPSVYPIPLDIKDAVKHCKTAKTLFKKQAI
tara:strand:- start:455 stop:1123 length:669 start_codon:yes stop_codon:yes gene_type:complete